MKRLLAFLSLAALFTMLTTLNAQDIVVNGSGLPGTYNTISAAVQAANPGDKILVSNQAFPYQEDTLFIDKDVTIMPFSEITYIGFEGDIQVTLDSISNLTLIGFDSPQTNLLSVFNDTTRNFLSTVNIVDCEFQDIEMAQPKTSLYLSYSTANSVYFSHGDIIGNEITYRLGLGLMDWSGTENESGYSAKRNNFHTYDNGNYLGNSSNDISQCELFNLNVSFGDVQTYTDTCNIIANDFEKSSGCIVTMYSTDFAFNIRNNDFKTGNSRPIVVLRACSSTKGVNNVINNDLAPSDSYNNSYQYYYQHGVMLGLSHCNGTHNFQDVSINILNNNCISAAKLDIPNNANASLFNSYNLSFSGVGICAYNQSNGQSEFNSQWLLNGPSNNNNNDPNPNPSQEFLNLDLTPNTKGLTGGSDAWSNYHQGNEAGFGTLTGSKARITYLNLPTQIFDPNNIQIKAKAVHGN